MEYDIFVDLQITGLIAMAIWLYHVRAMKRINNE